MLHKLQNMFYVTIIYLNRFNISRLKHMAIKIKDIFLLINILMNILILYLLFKFLLPFTVNAVPNKRNNFFDSR